MTGKRKSNRTYLSELYAVTEKLKAEGKSDEAMKVFDIESQKKGKLFQRVLKHVCYFAEFYPALPAAYRKGGMQAVLDYVYEKGELPKEHYTVYTEIVKRGADPIQVILQNGLERDSKGFKDLIKKANPDEFERLVRVEIEEGKKFQKLLMQTYLNMLTKVDPEGYEIYQKKGLPGLFEYLVTRGDMTKDAYDSWKREREKAREGLRKVEEAYRKEMKENPEFREEEMKDFEP